MASHRSADGRRAGAAAFFAFAGFGVIEGVLLRAADPHGYPHPLSSALYAVVHASLYGAIGGAGFGILFFLLSPLLRRGREEVSGNGRIAAGIAGAPLFLGTLLFGTYWLDRLGPSFLTGFGPFGPVVVAAAGGGILALLAAGWAGGRGRSRPGLPVRAAGIGALLLALLHVGAGALLERRGVPAGTGMPNILLVTVDTLRDDHLPPYGYGRDTAPLFTRFAAEGALFLNALASAPFTQPATASLLTGLHPHTHGVRNHPNILGENHETLAESAARAGYRTAAFSSQGLLLPRWGFGQGFALFERVGTPNRFQVGLLGRALDRAGLRPVERNFDARAVTERALRWLGEEAETPFLLWLHYLDPHHPYEPPPEYARRFDRHGGGPLEDPLWPDGRRKIFDLSMPPEEVERYVDRYDGEIRYTDDQIARVAARLEEMGLLDETIVVLTSDHGESLGEHGLYFAHTHYLYEPSMSVPLLLRYPPAIPPGTVVEPVVRLVDLAPTLLDLAGIAPIEGGEGRSLLPAIRGEKEGARIAFGENGRTIFGGSSEENPRWMVEGDAGRWSMARTGDYKLIRIPHPAGPVYELYDLRADPGEKRDIAAEAPEIVRLLAEALGEWMAEDPGVSVVHDEVDDQTLQDLRSLGYVH